MIGVIMAGGFGTRLKPLTCNIPKPMVPVLNRPMMEHIIRLLRHHGITHLISLLLHQPDRIINYFGDGSKLGVDMTYIQALEDFGTAGSVKKAAKYLDQRFLVISGDLLTDFDLTQAIQFHKERQAKATMILTHVKNPLAFGIVLTSKEGRIVRFLEKPSWGQVFSDTVNTGIYILEPEVLDQVPPKKLFDFSKDLFPRLLEQNQPLYGYIAEGYWRDVGNLTEYQQAHADCLKGLVKLRFPGQRTGNVWIGQNCRIDDGVSYGDSVVIGDNCVIAAGAKISNTVIGNNCHIGEGCSIIDSVLWENVTLGKAVSLTSDVIASGVRIGDQAFIQENVFVSENCSLGKGSSIRANVKIWPDKVVEDGAVLTTSLVWGDRWLRELFTDARVTGLANSEISPEFSAKLGAAFGAMVGAGNYLVSSRDASEAARMVSRALISGFMSSGVHVHDLRVAPIPIVRYQLRSGLEKGGVHVRKSPFDEKLIDILFFDENGRDLPIAKAKSIERLFFREDFRRALYDQIGKLDFPMHVTESYTEDLLDHLDVKAIEEARFKVVIDCSHGGATTTLPSLLRAMDCEVVTLNAYLDSKKLTRDKAAFERDLKQLSHIVTSLTADIGFLIDAGAEKIFVVDEKGRYIDSDRLLILVSKILMEANSPQKIAVPVTASGQI
ncbi:MAG: sugar phosphate nucleotidyltransferase, partial [candidate division KSB1 bacterium]|nr:sugar phosphate nucleotidyltransferase [candidate division KSB1 bacterium]